MTSVRRVPIRPLLLLSGAAGLIYEVVWARQLVLVFGNTSQAVSAILTGFFGGLAIGGVVGGRLAGRVARPLRLYGALELRSRTRGVGGSPKDHTTGCVRNRHDVRCYPRDDVPCADDRRASLSVGRP